MAPELVWVAQAARSCVETLTATGVPPVAVTLATATSAFMRCWGYRLVNTPPANPLG